MKIIDKIKNKLGFENNNDFMEITVEDFKELEKPEVIVKSEWDLYKGSKEYVYNMNLWIEVQNSYKQKRDFVYPYIFDTIKICVKKRGYNDNDWIPIKKFKNILKLARIHGSSYSRFSEIFFVNTFYEELLKYNWIFAGDSKKLIKWIPPTIKK